MPIGISTGAAVLGAGALGAGASLASGVMGANAADKAAQLQANSASQALALQQQEFNVGQQNLAPYLGIGSNAVNSINQLYGYGQQGGQQDFSQFTNSPDYQFAQQQGNLGVQRYLSATGLSASGGAMKDISSFNQGLASQQYGNYFSRLMGLATLGNNAATTSSNVAMQGANTMGNTIQGIGQAQASGVVGSSNALTGALSGVAGSAQNSALLYSLLGGGNKSSYGLSPSGSSFATQNASPGGGLGG